MIKILFFIYSISVFAKVDPPNYNFSLDRLESFMPGKSLNQIPKELGKGDIIDDKNETKTYRYFVDHIRYKFPVMVQAYNGVITDFHAILPSYFLHDVFHQSLINRYGKQTKYLHYNRQAVYRWENKNGNNHVYSGACANTCYTIFYAVYPTQAPQGPSNFVPLIEKLRKKENYKKEGLRP